MSKLFNRYTEYIYVLIVGAIIAAHACNPVKKVLNDPNKVQQVYNEYIKKNPTKPDTNTVYVPGDTLTQIIIKYDTTLLKGKDSLTRDTVRIKNNVYTNKYIHDTVRITTRDTKIENDLRNMLIAREVVIDQKIKEFEDMKTDRSKWRLYFFILLTVSLITAGLTIYLKSIKRVKV